MNHWYEQAAFYHIYPLGMCGAPKENNQEEVVCRLEELEDWLLHIKNIGCNALYIGPLFESVGHGYETTDYKLVDRRLGDNDTFVKFVKRSHELGIKIVVDGVFNHTGRRFFAFEDLKNNRENSKYRDWYCNVNFCGNNEFQDGFSYDAWRGYNILVKLNLKNPEVKGYLLDVVRYWVDTFDIDGIRLDCADVLDFDFMKELRAIANTVKEDFWLMGEVIHGDYSRWVNDYTLHSVTNYELHKGLYSGHNDHNYFEIAHTIRRLFDQNGGICKGARLYTFLDNHDVDRIASKLNDVKQLYSLYTLVYALPGIPSIYYGSEFAIEGKKSKHSDEEVRPELKLSQFLLQDLDESNISEQFVEYKEEYRELLSFIAKLGKAKEEYEELTYGSYKELLLTNRQYAFAKIKDNHCVIACVNNDENEVVVNIPSPIGCSEAKNILTGEVVKCTDGKISVAVNGGGGALMYI